MKRRIFLSVGAVFSYSAQAQTKRLPLVGSVNTGSYAPNAWAVTAVYQAMAARGYVEGKTVEYEHLWANEQYDRLPEMAAQMVNRKADLILTTSVAAATRAVMNATRDIPILFALSNDPVEAGLVASLARPGGNVTGIYNLGAALYPKWLELLSDLEPKAPKIGILTNSNLAPSRARRNCRAPPVQNRSNSSSFTRATNRKSQRSLRPWQVLLSFHCYFRLTSSLTDTDLGSSSWQHGIACQRWALLAQWINGLRCRWPDDLSRIRQPCREGARRCQACGPSSSTTDQFDLILNMGVAKTLGVSFPLVMQAAATEIID